MRHNKTDEPQTWHIPRIFQHADLKGCIFQTENIWHKNQLPADLNRAVPKRQAEFMAGRWCVAQLYRQHRVQSQSPWPKISESRAPIWPKGWTGSITHSSGHAAAVIGSRSNCTALGLDLEPIIEEKTAQKVRGYILHPDEERLVTDQLTLSLIFSFKESIYKALNPILKRFIGFQEVVVSHIDQGQICFSITGPLTADFPEDFPVQGRYLITEGFVITAYEVPF